MAGMLEEGRVVSNKTSCFSHLLPPSPLLPSKGTAANCPLPGVPRISTLLPQGGAGPLALINFLSPVQKGSLLSCHPHRAWAQEAQAAQIWLWW